MRMRHLLIALIVIATTTSVFVPISYAQPQTAGYTTTYTPLHAVEITQKSTGVKINITPTATRMAKFVYNSRGNMAFAIALAGVLEGVDYLLDPKNNRVVFKPKPEGAYQVHDVYGATAEEACQKWLANINTSQVPHYKNATTKATGQGINGYCNVWGGSEKYTGNVGATWRHLNEIDDMQVAQRLINQAKQGSPQAQQLLVDIITQQAQMGEYDRDFEHIIKLKGINTQDKSKEEAQEQSQQKKCLPVTEDNIRKVLEPTTELTKQPSVSLLTIQAYVRRIENGEHASRMPDMKVAENIIIEGHHRFISAKLCGQEAPRNTWDKYPYDKSNVYPVKNIVIGNY